MVDFVSINSEGRTRTFEFVNVMQVAYSLTFSKVEVF